MTETLDREAVVLACQAVARGGLRPAALANLNRGLPTGQLVSERIAHAMLQDRHVPRTTTWWAAHGPGALLALVELTGVDEGMGTHIIGAVLTARIEGGLDISPGEVLRTAERAVVWHKGRESAR